MPGHDRPPCPTCGGTDFFGIPDSLAASCRGCGFVWVGSHGDYEPGKTLTEWAADFYELAQKRDREKVNLDA